MLCRGDGHEGQVKGIRDCLGRSDQRQVSEQVNGVGLMKQDLE